MLEVFKDIPGYEGKYQVSNLGRVKSLARTRMRRSRWGTVSPYTTKEVIVRPRSCGDGYVCVGLDDKKNRYIHELVMLVFVGQRPKKHEILHRDGNKKNNSQSNLRYGTKSENNYDFARHDILRVSRKSIVLIKRASGIYRDIAKKYNVSPSYVGFIKRGERRIHG